MHVLESGGEGSDETMASLVGGKGVPPAQLTRMLARQLGLPEPDMPAPPAPPPPPAEGEETADADAKFELPVWSAKSEPDEVGVIEWGAAPPGQEALRFVFDGLPLDLQQAEDGSQASPTVDALRTAALVPTVVLILDDEPAGEEGEDACVGRGRTDEAKESGFFYNLGREALLERDTGVMFPFNEARDLQSAHLAPGSALCTQLTDAGAKVLRLSGRMRLAELVEAAAARIDPLIYGKDLDVPDGPLLGATKIDSYEPSSVLGTVSDAGEPVAEAEGMQVLGHLKGFCPVTWRRSRAFVPGRPEFVARWRGLLYLFKGVLPCSARPVMTLNTLASCLSGGLPKALQSLQILTCRCACEQARKSKGHSWRTPHILPRVLSRPLSTASIRRCKKFGRYQTLHTLTQRLRPCQP